MAYPKINKVELNDTVKDLLKSKDTVKVLATKDKYGTVHAVFKGSISVNDAGNITLIEVLESSQTNRNLTHAIWFNEHVSVLLKDNTGNSYQIKGIPYADHTVGPEYEEVYKNLIARNPDADVAGYWEIIPDEVRLETFKDRLQEEIETLPILGHADKDFIG